MKKQTLFKKIFLPPKNILAGANANELPLRASFLYLPAYKILWVLLMN